MTLENRDIRDDLGEIGQLLRASKYLVELDMNRGVRESQLSGKDGDVDGQQRLRGDLLVFDLDQVHQLVENHHRNMDVDSERRLFFRRIEQGHRGGCLTDAEVVEIQLQAIGFDAQVAVNGVRVVGIGRDSPPGLEVADAVA